MDNIKELLKKIDGVPETDDMKEVEKWLKTRNMQIGKMQQTLTKTSERYVSLKAERDLVEAVLKLLRKRAKEEQKAESREQPNTESEEEGLTAKSEDSVSFEEEGGLVAKNSTYTTESEESGLVEKRKQFSEEEPSKDMDALYNEYSKVKKSDDVEAQKQMYKKMSIEAENGNADALAILGCINDAEGKRRRAGRLWDMAANMGSPLGYYKRAYALNAEDMIYGFEKDYIRMWEDLGKYLEIRQPLNIKQTFTQSALLLFYQVALQLDKKDGICNRTKDINKIKDDFSKLCDSSECPEEYKGNAQKVIGDILVFHKQYTEAVGYYLKAGWTNSVDRILDVFYQIEDRSIREKLEAKIIQAREDSAVTDEVKAAIFCWYGQRYEEGTDIVPDKIKSFMNYWEAEKYGSKKGKSKRINLLMTATESMDFLAEDFLISIGEEGYWDAYKYMGDRYEKLFGLDNYKKAQEYYIKGQNGTMADECKEKCNKLSERIDNATRYNKAVEYLGTDRYMEAFEQLKKLARQGFAEACYKVAEISEGADKYMAVKLQGYLLDDQDIRNNYRKAATAGMRPAIERMIDIYSYGLFGANRDNDMVKKWKDKLK